MSAQPTTVAVTGASGYLGLHCVLSLLRAGHTVRATLRSLSKVPTLEAALAEHLTIPEGRLSWHAADLSADDGWTEALTGSSYVLHVASPFPATTPKHDDELIVPAREGALRVLRAAHAVGVKRVVMTSSVVAVVHDAALGEQVRTEANWSDPNQPIGAYPKSKTIAERAAWELVATLDGMELSVMNPGLILGPPIGDTGGTSVGVVQKLVHREMPGTPNVHFSVVDVRDVAEAHVIAMTHPEAPGERFILSERESSFTGIARELADAGYKVPTRQLPNALVRFASLFRADLRIVTPNLGKRHPVSSDKARATLGWQPRPLSESVRDTAAAIA